MTETLVIDDLTYRVQRSSKRRTIGITIDRDGSLVLNAPTACPWRSIESMGREKSLWVYSKLAERELLFRPAAPREFVSGESLYYLGRCYRLLIVRGAKESRQSQPLLLRDGRFRLRAGDVPEALEHFREWYAEHLLPWITGRVDRYADRVGVRPSEVVVRDLGYRWGSCSATGKLNFHWCVACLPPALIEYLVVHEMTHHKAPRHDQRFWSLVERVLPDYQQRRRRLAEEGGRYICLGTKL